MAQGLLHLLYPPHCLICKTYLSADSSIGCVCLPCHQNLQPNIPPFCPKCSRFLGSRPSASRCSSCRRHDPHFDFAWSCCLYNEFLKILIHSFKYHQRTYLRHYFAQIMINFIGRYTLDIHQFDGLLPIPLSATRLRERGYNQSALLAKILSRTYRIPIIKNALIRVKETKTQVLLTQKERWTNMSGAFRIKNSSIINSKNILLIDDLLTTGATSSEAAKTLKDAKANRVGVLTVAIAE